MLSLEVMMLPGVAGQLTRTVSAPPSLTVAVLCRPGAVAHGAMLGQRDFRSHRGRPASEYAVNVVAPYAAQARQLLGQLSGQLTVNRTADGRRARGNHRK